MKKAFAPVLCVALLGLFISGCAGGAIRQTNQSLSVYYNKEWCPQAFSTMVSKYEGEYPNIKFNMYDPTGGDTSMTEENAIKKMDTDIMVGKGPDLIIAPTSDMDVYKMARAGAFCDINPFIRKDSMFDLTFFNQAVLNAGVIDGKRYLFPLAFRIPILLMGKAKIAKSGFQLNKCTDADRFNSEALRVLGQDSSASLFNQDGYGELWSFQFPDAFNFTKQQATFDTPQFQKAMELCKEEYIREKKYPEITIGDQSGPEYTEYLERFDQNDILFDETLRIGWQMQEGSFFQTFDQAETYPVYNNAGGFTAQVELFAAIPSSSPNRQNAYTFLRSIFTSSDFMKLLDTPVLNSGLDAEVQTNKYFVDKALNSSSAIYQSPFPVAELPESFYQTCASYPAKVNRVILNMTPYDELLEQFQPYFEGKETYEKCLKDAKNYFDLYMSE